MKGVQQYIIENRQRFLDELLEMLRIPSISADAKYKSDVARNAEYVAESLKNSGCLKVEIYPTGGHPIVYGEHMIDPALPTVLVYGHYDVQPPDPLDLWKVHHLNQLLKRQTSTRMVQFLLEVRVMIKGRCLCM